MTTAETSVEPLRRNKQFQLMWIGATASALGSSISALAYPLLVLALTGSAGMAGVVGAVGFATALLFSLPGGVWVDRWDRRVVLLSSETIRAVAVGTVALAAFGNWLTFAHIVVVAGVNGAVGALFTPAREVAIRSVVKPEHLGAAYSQEHARMYGVTLIGPPAGGVLFSLGCAVPFLADAVSFLVSLVCVALAKVPRRPANYVPATAPRSMRADIAEAARWLWGQRMLRAITLFALAVNLGGSMLSLPTIVPVQQRGGSPTVVGIVMAGMGVGGLIGAVLVTRISALLPINHLLLAVCGVDALLLLAIIAPFGPCWPVVPLLCTAVLGPALAIPLQVQLAKQTPENMMARVQSLLGVTMSAIMPVGPILSGFLTEGVGVTWTIVIAAAMFALCTIGGLFSPTLRRGPDAEVPGSTRPAEALHQRPIWMGNPGHTTDPEPVRTWASHASDQPWSTRPTEEIERGFSVLRPRVALSVPKTQSMLVKPVRSCYRCRPGRQRHHPMRAVCTVIRLYGRRSLGRGGWLVSAWLVVRPLAAVVDPHEWPACSCIILSR